MPTKIGLISLGCAKNLVDSEHMLAKVKQDGMEIVNDVADADVAIINTCGFIESAKAEAIENILETAALKKTGSLKGLIVTGCLTQRYKDEFIKEIPEVDAILGTGSYENIVEAVHAVMQGEKFNKFGNISEAESEGERVLLTPRYSAYLKIAEGCDNRCAYCVIPSLRGKFRSRKLEDILAEARALAESGTKEIIIVAQDITRYGIDLYKKRRLAELLDALCEMDFTWVRLHYLYPDEIDDNLIDTIARQDKIVKYLDIPIQHVNNRILKAMHRRGDRKFISDLLLKLRDRIPNVVLRTSLIVGLPGETDEEFTDLCEFLQEMKIERAGVFIFSPEEGSEAAEMPDQVDDETKSRRQFIVEEIQSEVIDEFNRSMLGKALMVLCEGWDEDCERYYGRSFADSVDIDGKVFFYSKKKCVPGDFVCVTIEDSMGADLVGAALE